MFKPPVWFDLNNYKKNLTIEDWAYEIWVRANFFQHATMFGSAKFKVQSGIGPLNKMLIWLGNGLPASSENYTKFLSNRDLFMEYFSRHIVFWREEKENQAIKIYDLEDILPRKTFDDLPDQLEKGDVELLLYSWCDSAQPIGVNLEKTDEELFSEFRNYIKSLREDQKEFFSLGKSITEQTKKWSDFKLLALFDLLYWRTAFDSTLTYTQIGYLIWPDDTIEIEQRVRKRGLPLIEKVFSESVAKMLYLEHLKTV